VSSVKWAERLKTPSGQLFLAPMEGVVDHVMRDLLTRSNAFDATVTEFMRVTDHLHSRKSFFEFCPELAHGSLTPSGTPVIFQLLGSDADALAVNAARACELGAFGIDLNFGCPAKTVNRHDGGAALLKTPYRILHAVKTVRALVPSHISVSAKIRLGFDSPENVVEIAQAVEEAGATWLTIHARTKTQMYTPPAHWEWVAKVAQAIHIPIISNGEIWSAADARRCQEVSLTNHLMIGRGAIANPFLADQIKGFSGNHHWQQALPMARELAVESFNYGGHKLSLARTKQWTLRMGKTFPESQLLFEKIKTLNTQSALWSDLEISGPSPENRI
jgi:tRNA-dihydrouridine synthase C